MNNKKWDKNQFYESEEKWRKEQIFEGDAEVYGVAYKFKKSKIPFGKKRKLLFPFMFIFLFIAICAMGSGLVSGIVNVSSNNQSEALKLQSINYYAVNTGSFSSVELASDVASRIKQLGGAGYVYNHNGEYNVLLYVYKAQDDAISVSQKVTEQGFTTNIIAFNCNAKNYDFKLSSEDSLTFQSVINSFDEIYQSLYNISNNYDNGITTISASRLELVTLQKDFERKYTKFMSTFSNTKDESIINLIKKLDIVSSELDILVDPLMLDSNFASLIKHSCINIVIARYEL
ncbi:MAG: SPOR domain-containing protein [Christensenellales bacterium]